MPLEFDQPTTRGSRLSFDEPQPRATQPAATVSSEPRAPAGGASSRSRSVVEMAQRLFEEPSTRGTGERTIMGGAGGFAAPELTAMTGMGLQLFPYTRPAGMALTKLAPALGSIRGRTAMLGAGAGAAGGVAEEASKRSGFSPETSRLIGTGTEMALGTLPIGGLAARAARPPGPVPPRSTQVQAQELGSEAIARGQQEAAEATKQARAAAEPRFRQQRSEQRQAQEALQQESRMLEMAPTEANVGEMTLSSIERQIGNLRSSRKTVADQMYADADRAMTDRYRRGDYWQLSQPGKDFIRKLESRLSTEGGTTKASTDEQKLIRDVLLPNLRGQQVAGAPASSLLGAEGMPARAAEAGRIAYSEPNVLRETLRKLRDASRGLPEEGYGAIGQQRAGELAEDLAKSLSSWENSLARADARYRELSELLLPTQTARGRAATATERFSAEELAIDPARLPRMFFQSPQSVSQLKALLGGNTDAVNRLASLYTAANMRGKTPEQARRWLESNRDWLNPQVLPQPFATAQGMVSRLESATTQAAQARRSAAGTVERFVEGSAERREALKRAQDTINRAVATLDVADPNKLPAAWGRIRGELESTGLVRSSDLDALGQEIQRAAREASQRDRRELIIKAIIKYVPWAGGIFGAYTTFGALTGGR